MKSRFMKRMLSFILATVLLMGNVMPVMAEGSVSGNEVAETVVEETVVEESAVSQEPVSESEVNIEEESSEVSTTETTEETSSVESATEESAEQTTEVSTEEATEDSISENEIPEDELSVSENEIIDEEVPLAGALPVCLEPVTVNGITITVSGPASAFAEGTTVSVVEVEPAEVVIEAAEESEQAEVKRYKAFDINLVCDGEVVQPLNGEEITVNFEGDLLIPNTNEEEDVVVYHVDDNDEITKMEAEVATVESEDAAQVETVEMTTTHFSTYVVVITGAESEYEVIYRHYADVNGDGTKEQFYKPTTEIIKANVEKTYTDFETAGKTVGGADYTISTIFIDYEDESKADVTIDLAKPWPDEVNVEIAGNATIEFYYEPVINTGASRYENEVILYDYNVAVPKEVDIYVEKGDRIKLWGWSNFRVEDFDNDRLKLRQTDYYWTHDLNKDENRQDGLEYNGTYYASYKYVGKIDNKAKITVIKSEGINDVEIQGVDDKNGRFLGIGIDGERDRFGKLNISGTNGGNANVFNGGNGHPAIVQGIVSGLSSDLKTVRWGKNSHGQDIVEPGYFTQTEIENIKTIYDTEFKLRFDQKGNNYQLYSVYSDIYNTETLTHTVHREYYNDSWFNPGDISGQFFPLENVPSATVKNECTGKEYNWYFGMRYDFSFELGDYIGPLEYEFVGDDDLWVFVDGEPVLDLGGIHSAYPSRYNNTSIANKVDIWETYFGISKAEREANPDDWWEKIDQLGNGKYDPDKNYTVTVLYMERGGYASSCFMNFTMPNIESRHANQYYGSASFVKKAGDTNLPLEGAVFTLFDAAGNAIKTDTSKEDGVIRFQGLVAGNYTLKETKTPEGYIGTEEEWKVVVSETTVNDNTTVNVAITDAGGNPVTEIVNEPEFKDINLEFVKVDNTDSAITLAGAEFELTSTADETFKKTATSDENGKILFEDIDAGVYTLKETKAPEGYKLPSEETLTITVEVKDGELGYTVSGNESNIWLQYGKDGENHLLKNSKTVDITIRKDWQDKDGNPLATDEMEKSVTVELFRKVGNNDLTKESVQKNIILSAENEWTVTIEDLDSCGKDGVWTYSIEETDVKGFEAIYTEETEETTPDNIVLVVTNKEVVGSLKITKKVNRVDSEHGAAAFMFKITCADGSVLYRTITFEGDIDTDTTKSVVVANLPVGECTVEELTALRYECKSDVSQTKEIEAKKTTEYSFRNEKDYDKNYSHTDVVVNKVTFEKDANGNIIGATRSQEKSSTSEVVTE